MKITFIAIATSAALGLASQFLPTPTDGCPVAHVVAHRGGWADVDRTEDTVGAYVAAHAYGVDVWETDVRFDRRGMPYLMHDSSIDRTTTGAGSASSVDVTVTTVRMNDRTRLADQTLARLLAYAAKYGATVAIEPKVVPTAAQAKTVLAVIDQSGMRSRVVFDSFRAANLAPIKALAPDLVYALVSSTAVAPATAAGIGSVVMIQDSALTSEIVAGYHAAGLAVYAWTANTPTEWFAHRDLGIDRVMTDRPARYLAWRAWMCR